MSTVVPFVVPAKFVTDVRIGTVKQVGALLKDASNGRIVAHMQETGAMQKIASQILGNNPLSAIGQIGLDAANTAFAVRADRKLTALTSMVQGLQAMQLVGLVFSVAGIGVTVASTMVILNRLKGITDGLTAVAEKIDALPQAWQELEIQKTLGDVQTQLERLEEIETRKSVRPVLEKVEEKMHDSFNRLHHGAISLVVEATVDAQLLQQVLAGLAISGGAQVRVLYELDEVSTAGKRAQNQFEKLQALSLQMPRDLLAQKLNGDAGAANQLANTISRVRLNTASQPSLAEQLVSLEVSGPDYLARAKEEEDEPMLLLPIN